MNRAGQSAEPQTKRPLADLAALHIHRQDEPIRSPVRRIIAWTAVFAGLVAAAWAGYSRWIVPRRAPVVETTIIKPAINIGNPPLLTAAGYLVADRQARITPKISGKVVALQVETGKRVHRNDVLAVLESTTLQTELDDANAQLAQAQHDFDRQAALWRDGVTSRSLYDSAASQLESATAKAAGARINLQDMVIRAPFDGTIATKNTEIGEVVTSSTLGQVGGTLPSGAICTLVDLATLQMIADVNESSIAQVHEGQAAEVTVDAFPGQKWNGVLTQIIPTADRAKAIVQVKVAIRDATPRLLPEMSASVSFLRAPRTQVELSELPKIWLSPAAIVDGRVAVVDLRHRVIWRPVTAGATRDGRIEVRSGLRDGERVVTESAQTLEQGELVRLARE
jgi:RND family efflux transporter MFP subunit